MILEEKVKGTSEKSSHPMMNDVQVFLMACPGVLLGTFLVASVARWTQQKWGGRCVFQEGFVPMLYWVLWFHIIPTSNDPS